MGQYYKPIILDEQGDVEFWLNCYDFNFGAKLMEHSWLRSEFVQAVETLLVHEAPRRVVWAGDYADAEVDPATSGPLIVKSKMYSAGEGEGNLYVLAELSELAPYRPEVPSLGKQANYEWFKTDRSDPWRRQIRREKPKITYTRDPEVVATATPQIIPTQTSHPFLLNWDKRQYVNKRRVPRVAYGWDADRKRAIHPLPLLTVEGNGRGGGDFRTDDASGNFDLIGSWARDHISLAAKRPEADGWTEVVFDLIEPGALLAQAVA